ncbi:MAG TPA: endonuclease III [Bacteroidota bacterium]
MPPKRLRKKAGRKKKPRRPPSKKVVSLLRSFLPNPRIELEFGSPLELLVATVLSAQCTDQRVNLVTKDLFRKYHTAKEYANANPVEFETEIRSTGFFRSKTKSIINCCKAILERHDGAVPNNMEELVELPGIGRKTANVILGQAFGISSGIVVDTHVQRVSQRLGLTRQSNPEKIELDLMKQVPQEDWIDFGTMMVLHGRYVCQARKPKCPECVLVKVCPSAESFLQKFSSQ